MILSNEFTVGAPMESTWRTLMDVERVAGCLPGAAVEPVGEDGVYRGALKLKVGPVMVAYDGTVRLLDVDDASRTLSYDAAAREQSGPGTATAMIRTRLTPDGDGSGTHVSVETELNVTGRAAQFGRGIMEDVAGRTLGAFATALQRLIAESGSQPGDAVGGLVDDGSSRAGGAAPTKGNSDDVLDVGATLWSFVPRRTAAIAAVAIAATLTAIGRRRRRGIELTVTLRLR